MITIPNTKQIIEAGSNAGAIGVGLIVGKILQSTVMKNANGQGFIPDNLLTNISAMAVLAVGSILVPNKFASLVMAATAGYFLIRTVNKGTAKLSGLGSLSTSIKDFVNKYVPQLSGNTDDFESLNGDEYANTLDFAYGNITEPALLPPSDMEMANVEGFNQANRLLAPSSQVSSFSEKLA